MEAGSLLPVATSSNSAELLRNDNLVASSLHILKQIWFSSSGRGANLGVPPSTELSAPGLSSLLLSYLLAGPLWEADWGGLGRQSCVFPSMGAQDTLRGRNAQEPEADKTPSGSNGLRLNPSFGPCSCNAFGVHSFCIIGMQPS